MEQNKEKLKRKNLLVGWSMAAIALILYVAAIYFN